VQRQMGVSPVGFGVVLQMQAGLETSLHVSTGLLRGSDRKLKFDMSIKAKMAVF